ncbi:MAG: glycosyltransferase family 39 protein [Conexibacter sp.]
MLAAALRLPSLGTQSLWFDEIYTLDVVRAHGLGGMWDRVGATESTPPLFYALTWVWTRVAGDGEAALRTVSALALIAAVPVAYAALWRLVGRRAALATAALLAVSPLMTWYALDARAYGLLVLTALLSVWAFAAALEDPTPKRLALWALAAAAAMWTHWFAGFLILGEAVALLWLRRDAWRRTIAAAAGALLALAPLAALLHEQTGDDRAAFIAHDPLGGRLVQLVRQFASGPNVPRTSLEAAALALFLAALAVGALLALRRALAARRGDASDAIPRDGARALLATAAVGLLVPLALAVSGVYDRFSVRNVIFLWPLAAALAAPALLRLRAVPLAALLALGVAISLWTTNDWRYGNSDWRGAIGTVKRQAAGVPVIAVTPLGRMVAAHYLARPPLGGPLSVRRAWVVVDPIRVPGNRAFQPADPPAVAALLAAFPRHREWQLHAFRLIELSAPAPVSIDLNVLPAATVFAGRPSSTLARR